MAGCDQTGQKTAFSQVVPERDPVGRVRYDQHARSRLLSPSPCLHPTPFSGKTGAQILLKWLLFRVRFVPESAEIHAHAHTHTHLHRLPPDFAFISSSQRDQLRHHGGSLLPLQEAGWTLSPVSSGHCPLSLLHVCPPWAGLSWGRGLSSGPL